MTMPRATPRHAGPQPNPPDDDDREGGQPYATEVDDYQQGVASPPVEHGGREANRKAKKAPARK